MQSVLTLQLMARLLSVFAVVQSIEFLIIARPIRFIFNSKAAVGFECFRLIAAALTFIQPQPWSLIVLLLIHLVTIARWLGNFNGGSDYMNSILLLFTSVGLLIGPDKVARACLWYMTFQLCFSYVKAGYIKVVSKNWRSGLAFSDFVNSPIYQTNEKLLKLTRSSFFNKLNSWAVIAFELTFPICLVSKKLALVYMAVGVVFHLTNAVIFGLNRFTFAWVAAYPAVYWSSL